VGPTGKVKLDPCGYRLGSEGRVQLTLYTDYALRTLLYLGVNPDRPVPVAEIAAAYGISANHVAKCAQALVSGGFARTRRGRAGGLELALPPERVRVGDVVRVTEPTVDLLACFDAASTSCPITGPWRR
jgi:Rrf2 family nitric oxide-sensitive transcriptional repressor